MNQKARRSSVTTSFSNSSINATTRCCELLIHFESYKAVGISNVNHASTKVSNKTENKPKPKPKEAFQVGHYVNCQILKKGKILEGEKFSTYCIKILIC